MLLLNNIQYFECNYIYIFHVENTYNAFLKIYTIYKICYIYMYSQYSIYSICVYDAINLMYI